MVLLPPGGEKEAMQVEQVIPDANAPQLPVPAGWWTARHSRPVPTWTLVRCVVSPGFAFEDLELAQREALLCDYPRAEELILALP